MAAIDYVVRDNAGRLTRGTVGIDPRSSIIQVDSSSEISLNLARVQIHDYRRIGANLQIILEDGRVVVLEDFFSEIAVTNSRLYLSSESELIEITFSESWGRTNYAHFDAQAQTVAEEELVFHGSSGLVTETETTMAAPLFLGGGLWGAAGAAGAAGVAIAAGGGGGGKPVEKTVQEGDVIINGQTSDLTVAGTAPTNATVTVQVGDQVQETTPDDDGNWTVTFAGEDLPQDGEYTAIVTISVPNEEDVVLDGPTVTVDTAAPDVDVTSGTASVPDIIDANWHEGGVELGGTAEPGATIAVTINGVTMKTLAGSTGEWFVNFGPDAVPAGEYETPVLIVATDAAGNSTELADTLVVDTEANALDLSDASVAVDDVINAAENAEGVTATGTATPGAAVTVSIAGVEVDVVADASGNWTAVFGPDALPPGEYDTVLVATTTDEAGNSSTASRPLQVDTLGLVSVETAAVEGDGTINAAEQADGTVLTGKTQPGSSVEVTAFGRSYDAVVDADGDWSVNVPASHIATGEYSELVTATATDAAGNVTTDAGSIEVDTEVAVGIDAGQAGGDNLITAQEAQNGITLTGTTHPGADVQVTLAAVTKTATVSSDGTWSVDYNTSDLPQGLMQLSMSAVVTDDAGNTATTLGSVNLDTLGFVDIGPQPVTVDNIINASEAANGPLVTGTTQPGSSVTIDFGGASIAAVVAGNGTWSAEIPAGAIAPGTYTTTIRASATSPSGNVATDTAQVSVDTNVDNFVLTSGTVGGDGLLNAAEVDAPILITGTTEPGAQVTVSLAGVDRVASVASDGTWSATYPAGTLPSGSYPTSLTVTSTDTAGNAETITQAVEVDTIPGTLTLSGAAIEGDDVINAAEASDGVIITGTADPGALVQVTLGNDIKQVVSNNAGQWQAFYSEGEIGDGTFTSQISATTTDAAGNTISVSDSVRIDTYVNNFVFTGAVEGNNEVTGIEAADGVTVTGLVEAGSTVQVSLGAATVQAVVTPGGAWTANFAAHQVPEGEYTENIVAVATDAAGNTKTISKSVEVDTAVSNLAITDTPGSSGQVLTAAGAESGVVLSGTVEAGSSVIVTFEGTSQAASVIGATWTTTFARADIPTGEYTANVSVAATDAAGNTANATESFLVDTEAPGAPLITGYSAGTTRFRGLSTLETDGDLVLNEITAQGTVGDPNYTEELIDDFEVNEIEFSLRSRVSTGSDLMVTASDQSGNSASTLFVMETETDPEVDLSNPALQGFQVEAIDLQYASDAEIVLTEGMVKDLSQNTDTLTIHGSVDDNVTMVGAVKSSDVQQIGNQTYDVYTLGDDGVTVIIDRDIDVII